MLRSLFARFVQTAARRPALGSFDGDRRGRSPIRASRTSRGVRPCSGSAGSRRPCFVEQRLAAFELVVAFPPARPPVEQLRLLCFVEQRLAAFELVVAFPPVEQLRLLGYVISRGCCVRRVGARPRFAPARCFPARAARAWTPCCGPAAARQRCPRGMSIYFSRRAPSASKILLSFNAGHSAPLYSHHVRADGQYDYVRGHDRDSALKVVAVWPPQAKYNICYYITHEGYNAPSINSAPRLLNHV